MKKLENKVALVTGASKGIGAAIAKVLAADGATVIVNYKSAKEAADQVVDTITNAGGKAISLQADVANSADVARLFTQISERYSTIDILVNNAGIYQYNYLADIREEDFHRQFNTNVLSVLLVTQQAVNYFPATGGSIINISSTISHIAMPSSAVYAATKASVDMITKVLSKELAAKRIRVNAINPGMVETEGAHTAGFIGGEMQQQVVAQTPWNRIGQPDDIAPIAAFFASDASEWLTGEIVLASGGIR